MKPSGQQILVRGQMTRCEPFGQDLAAAGVADRSAAVPTAATKTIPSIKVFLRMPGTPRELASFVASAAPDETDGPERGGTDPQPHQRSPARGAPTSKFVSRGAQGVASCAGCARQAG